MAELTDNEIRMLNEEIERSGLTYTELQQELLDHLCCDIEAKMDEGIEFINALDDVKQTMGQDCIRKIQEDTLLLINQKYRMMKKFMYVIGSVAPSLVIIGTLFKIQHWPGANFLLTVGMVLLALVYLPVFISVKIRDTRNSVNPVKKSVYYVGIIAGIIFILGALFKIMHWPGASVMITVSSLVAVAVFIPMLVWNALRDKENQVQNFTLLIFVLSFAAITYMSFALRISKDVMSSFLIQIEQINATEQVLEERNAALYDKYGASDELLQAELSGLKDKSDALCDYLDVLVRKIMLTASERNIDAFDADNNMDPFMLVALDHSDAAPIVMILGVEGGDNQGEVLVKRLKDYRNYLLEHSAPYTEYVINTALETEAREHKWDEDTMVPWILYNFEHLPAISSVETILRIKSDIRMLEGEVLRQMAVDAAHKTMDEE